MVGHGSPHNSALLGRWSKCARVAGRSVLFALLCACAGADEPNLRLHIAWGGGQPRLWRGEITVRGGAVSHSWPLGLSADEPGALLEQSGSLVVAPRTARPYQGVELLATARRDDDVLRIELTPDNDADSIRQLEVPLAQLDAGYQRIDLDEMENRLVVERAPGDQLRVDLRRDNLVLFPGELWEIDVIPHRLGLPPGTSLQVRLQLSPARSTASFWEQEESLRVDASGSLPRLADINIPVPQEEGVYDLSLSLNKTRKITPLGHIKGEVVAERRVQFVVISPALPRDSTPAADEVVAEFNPANPRWFDRLRNLPQWKFLLPGFGKGALGNFTVFDVDREPQSWDHDGGKWTRLPGEGWVAYPLPVERPGMPHTLEIEFPSDIPQTVGISIIEPNAAGEVLPVALDSGLQIGDLDVSVSAPDADNPITRHRLVFWPRTKSPVVLITNRQSKEPAVFGSLQITAQQGGLPFAAPGGGRKRIAYMDRPFFPENFMASEVLDPRTGRSLEDWATFYDGGRRLVEYLRFAGYDGLAISVACEGSTIYPSQLLAPTPRYDRGVFLTSGQDAIRKDVLEMLFRLCEQAGLELIPVVQFATPLPALESLLRNPFADATGIELVNAEGKRWPDVHDSSLGMAPYYNPLDRRVQLSMLSVIREIVTRYGDHPSYAGITVALTPEGFSQLPDVDWGLDDATVTRFQDALTSRRSDAVAVDFAQQLRRLAQRENTLPPDKRSPMVKNWLAWRSRQLADLYLEMARETQPSRGAKLFLSAVHLDESAPLQRHMRPALPRKTTIDDAMLELALDAGMLQESPDIVFLRPHRVAPSGPLATQAVHLEINADPVADRFFSSASSTATHFYHEPWTLRLPSFDRHSPFGKGKTYTRLLSHIVPSGNEALRPFAHGLAVRDDDLFFEGGWMLPMGQEATTQAFFDVFRQLPAARFETLQLEKDSPVVTRFHADSEHAYLYLVNDSPWPADVAMQFEVPVGCQMEPLGGRALPPLVPRGRRATWQVEVSPYDLVAVRFSSPEVQAISSVTAAPLGVARQLAEKWREVSARADQIEDMEPIAALQDPGFETVLGGAANAAWTAFPGVNSTARFDPTVAFTGRQSLKLESDGAPVYVRSQPFSAPGTGHVMMSVRLRSSKPRQQVPMVMRLETSNPRYRPSYHLNKTLSEDWEKGEFVLRADDVPVADNLRMRVSFELLGAGEVWIDEVRIFDKWFEPEEFNALKRIVYVAYAQHSSGDVGGCYRTLSGYWPRFLLRHVPPPAPQPVQPMASPPAREPQHQAAKPGMLDRIKRYMPRWR